MKYANIKYNDIANGEGVRTSIWVSGCPHHCKGCFNQEAWDKSYGKEFDEDIRKDIILSVQPSYIQGITILGGEPFAPYNIEEVLKFVRVYKNTYHYDGTKDLWIYTGYLYEDLLKDSIGKELLYYVDTLVDGPFIAEEYDPDLKFKGSKNQRILKLHKGILI